MANSKAGLTPEAYAFLQKWLNVVRLVSVLMVGAVILVLRHLGLLNFDPLSILLFVIPGFLLLIAAWYLLNKKYSSSFFLHLQLILDVIMITVGLELSGGIHSAFIFFYVVVLISASIISFKSTILVGISALLAYLSLIVAESARLIPVMGVYTGLTGEDLVRLGIFLALAVIVVFQSYYLVSRIRLNEAEFDQQKDDFLFRTVHDLRAPATGIRLLAEKYSDSKYPKEAQEDAKLAEETSTRMLKLIKDLLSFGKEEQGKMKLKREPVQLVSIIQNAVKEATPSALKMKVKLDYQLDTALPAAIGDAGALAEVFTNLLDNAVKYNKTGGAVTVSHEVDAKLLRTKIEDNGIGIAPENLDKLFTPYFRVGDNPGIQGTGLGLYVVGKLIEKMNGDVEISSALGEGTSFTISLPLA